MLHYGYVLQKIGLMGMNDYLALVKHVREASALIIPLLVQRDGRDQNLESLKTLALSVGLEELGLYVQSIERMLMRGADVTAASYLELLPQRFIESLDELDAFLSTF